MLLSGCKRGNPVLPSSPEEPPGLNRAYLCFLLIANKCQLRFLGPE